MKYLFLLSGDCIDLAKEEILSLFEIKNYKILDKLLIADLNIYEKSLIKFSRRLALTKNIYRLLFECKVNELIETMKDFDWNSVYKGSFCLRINKQNSTKEKLFADFSEKILAKYIWHSVKNPKVNLDSPKTKIELFITKHKVYCGLLIYENEGNFESRKSHLRPSPHPSSLHPKIARALVNLSGIEENETLLDPFCGTGGFLIEAGLMSIKAVGYDINKIMANGCIENLKYFKIRNYRVKIKNALYINDKFDCVVTDLPYGLNSNALSVYGKNWKKHRINKKIQTKNFTENLERFYLLFLKNLRKKLKKKAVKAVIVFPSFVNYKKLLRQSKFKVEKEFEQYVHRSLSRRIAKII